MGHSIMHQIIRDVRFDSVSVQFNFYPPGGWRTIFREDVGGRSSIDTTSLWRSVMESELPLRPKNDNPIDRFMSGRVVFNHWNTMGAVSSFGNTIEGRTSESPLNSADPGELTQHP